MNSETTLPDPPKGRRSWIPAAVVALDLAGMVWVQFGSGLERNFRAWVLTFLPAPALILILLWFLFLGRFRWRTRLLTVAGLLLAAFLLPRLVRFDGAVSGTGLPRLAWRWSSARSGLVETPGPAPGVAPAKAPAAGEIPDAPQFLGPNRDGVIPSVGLARDWAATPPKLLWRQPIGLGWSAFAVAGGRAFTQEQRGPDELVTCYDLLSGRLIWAGTNHVRFSEWQGGDGPRATPTIDRELVFTMGATGLLDCLEAGAGKLVWSRDALKENGARNLTWGMSSSPLVFEETVVVTGGSGGQGTVLAFRRTTGEPLWKSGAEAAGYTSPILVALAGRRVILSLDAATLGAYDPATGAQLLSYHWAAGKFPKASQPVVVEGDRVFLSAGYGAGCALLHVSAAPDGKLAAAEVWKGLALKTQFNSAAARAGFLYGLDDGLLACVDLATGRRVWKDGRYGSGQTLITGDLVLIQGERGEVALAAASPERFQEFGRISALSAKTWNYPTLAGRYLLVRNDQEAACYELPLAPSPADPAHPTGGK